MKTVWSGTLKALLVSIILTTVCPLRALADTSPVAAIKRQDLRCQIPLTEFIENARIHNSTLIKEADIPKFLINDLTYITLGRLGGSTAEAFLVQSPENQRLVIKQDKSGHRIVRAYYQMAITLFYQEHQNHSVRVPKIIDIGWDSQTIWLVTEYLEGLVFKDPNLEFIDAVPDKQLRHHLENGRKKLQKEAMRLFGSTHDKKKKSHFSVWLDKNRGRLHKANPKMAVLYAEIQRHNILRAIWEDGFKQTGDFNDTNLMLEFKTGEWVIYDP